MKGKLFLIQWDKAAADKRVKELQTGGWEVQFESEDGTKAHKNVREFKPNILLIDLTLKAAHGGDFGKSLRDKPATKGLLIIFVDGTQQDKERIKKRVADSVFTTSTELNATLDKFAVEENK